MNRNIQTQIDKLIPLWTATDEILNEWKGEGCLQLPNLLGMLAVKLNWNEKQLRENDPFVRSYLRNHDEWHVTRGAHGGIMRRCDKDKQEADKLAKKVAREQVEAAIAAKTAQKLAEVASVNVSSVEEIDLSDLDEADEVSA